MEPEVEKPQEKTEQIEVSQEIYDKIQALATEYYMTVDEAIEGLIFFYLTTKNKLDDPDKQDLVPHTSVVPHDHYANEEPAAQ